MIQRTLAIVSGPADPDQLRDVIPARADLLAIDLAAMQACRTANVRFATPSGFYRSEEFTSSFERTRAVVEKLFAAVDREYAAAVDYPYVLSSNLYYFLTYFSDLQYLGGIARAIRARYSATDVLTVEGQDLDSAWQSPMDVDIFGGHGIRKANAATYNLRYLRAQLGNPTVSEIALAPEDRLEQRRRVQWRRRSSGLVNRLTATGLSQRVSRKLGMESSRGKKVIWCVQDGYEVTPLRAFLPEFAFVDPVSGLKKGGPARGANIEPVYRKALPELNDCFPEWTKEIEALLQGYHDGVARRIPAVVPRIREQLDADRPHCALYSIGAGLPLDGVYAWLLNLNRVPIYSFQHGYSDNLYFTTPLNRYWEFNANVEQTNVLVSEIEYAARRHSNRRAPNHRDVVAGSIQMYERHKVTAALSKTASNGRVLYVQGRCPGEMWKNLFCSENDDVIFQKHEQLFQAVARSTVKLDIKLYPQTGSTYRPYFERFINRHQIADVRFVHDAPAEEIAPAYSVILVDYIATALNAFFMILDRPTIYYLAKTDLINPLVSGEFHQRHYVVSDGQELTDCLTSFGRGNLPSKYRPDYVDRFVCPSSGDNPGERIAAMVRSASADVIAADTVAPSYSLPGPPSS